MKNEKPNSSVSIFWKFESKEKKIRRINGIIKEENK